MKIKMETPKELIDFLIKGGLSQQAIAQEINISQATISRLIAGIHKDTRSEIKDRLVLLVNKTTSDVEIQ